MHSFDEDAIRLERERRLVQQEAARRDTASTLATARSLRYIGWACALLPVVGILGVALFMLIAFVSCIYAHSKGSPDAIRELLMTLLHGGGAGLLWLVVNVVALAVFGASLGRL